MGDKPKPICVVKISRGAMDGMNKSGRVTSYGEMSYDMNKMMPDYYVFVLPAKETPKEPQEEFEFQVFYEKDFTDIQYQELKELITEQIKTTTNG